MRKGLINYLAIATILASGCTALKRTPRNYSELNSSENITQSSQASSYRDNRNEIQARSLERIPNAPHYSNIKRLQCARYAVTVADKELGVLYTSANAWDLKYPNEVIYSNLGKGKLKKLLDEGAIPEGAIVTFYNSHSDFNFNNKIDGKLVPCKDNNGRKEKCKDRKGNPRKNTHAEVYAGKDSRGHIFYHQYDKKIKTTIFRNTPSYLTPVDVLFGKRKFNQSRRKGENSYTVKSGDSYWNIAGKHNIKPLKLMKANNCRSIKHKCAKSLKPGNRIKLPRS